MKTSHSLIILFLYLFIGTPLHAQYFEGVITYGYKYKDKTGFLKPKEAKNLLGSQQTLYVKNGKYKSRLNGMSEITHTYLGNDTIYTTEANIRAVMWIDANKQKAEIYSHRLVRKAARINRLKCDMLEIKTNKGTVQYYFHPDYKVDKKYYANHHYQLWAFCMEQTDGALPLKFVLDNKEESIELLCKSIRKESIEEHTFELPTGISFIPKPERRLR